MNGDHANGDLLKILNKFIDIYVLCPRCKLPETILVLKHKKDLYHRCAACGAGVPDRCGQQDEWGKAVELTR